MTVHVPLIRQVPISHSSLVCWRPITVAVFTEVQSVYGSMGVDKLMMLRSQVSERAILSAECKIPAPTRYGVAELTFPAG